MGLVLAAQREGGTREEKETAAQEPLQGCYRVWECYGVLQGLSSLRGGGPRGSLILTCRR